MDLDPLILLPALLFTVLALYVTSSLLKRTQDDSSSARIKQPKVGCGGDVLPSRPASESCPPPALDVEIRRSQVPVRWIDSDFDQFIGNYALMSIRRIIG